MLPGIQPPRVCALRARPSIRCSHSHARPPPPAPAQALFFNHLYDPISLVRDNQIKAAMAGAGVHCRSFNADVLFEPWLVLAEGGRPDTCCKDFWNRCARVRRSVGLVSGAAPRTGVLGSALTAPAMRVRRKACLRRRPTGAR